MALDLARRLTYLSAMATNDQNSETSDGTAEAPATPKPTGPGVIAAYLKTLTSAPGVYRMIDAAGEAALGAAQPAF